MLAGVAGGCRGGLQRRSSQIRFPPKDAPMKLSRRSFTTAMAAAAGLGPASIMRTARAAAGERINLGFIGVGTMGRGHVNRFLGFGDVQVVAVCDVVKARADSAKATIEKKYADAAK